MATVYQIQNPLRYLRDEKGDVIGSEPAYDVAAAWEHGEVKVMLPIGNRVLTPAAMVARLRHQLKGFTDEDTLLGIGDPISIGVAIAIAGSFNAGRVHVLRWNRTRHEYVRQLYNLNGESYVKPSD